jgi:Na+-translocating ferredoxin:NAD+ oxidoreductase RnfE subunit
MDGAYCMNFWHFVFYVVVSSLVTMCDIVMNKRWFWCCCSVGLRLEEYLVKVNCIIISHNTVHLHQKVGNIDWLALCRKLNGLNFSCAVLLLQITIQRQVVC